MSALNKMLEKMLKDENPSQIEICILWVLDDAEEWNEKNAPYRHASQAAAELAALRAKLEEAREIIEMLDLAANRDEIESVKSRAREWLK